MSIEEDHAQGGLALLNAAIPNRVYDTKVPDPTPDPKQGWVLVFIQVAWPREGLGVSLGGAQVGVTTTLTCHCVGANASAARIMAGLVRQALLNVRPTVTGRSCGPIKEDEALAPNRSEELGQLVVDATCVYSFPSVPT